MNGLKRVPGNPENWEKIKPLGKAVSVRDGNAVRTAILAGFGEVGELSPKPHPWLYAETARVGLGIPFEERHSVVGIEDSGAGVVSILLAGFAPIGIEGGNIIDSGTQSLCTHYEENFEAVLKRLH